jgi:hypothetical protein
LPIPSLLSAFHLFRLPSAPHLFPLSLCSLLIPFLPSAPHLFPLFLAYSLSSLSSSYTVYPSFYVLLANSFSSICSSLFLLFTLLLSLSRYNFENLNTELQTPSVWQNLLLRYSLPMINLGLLVYKTLRKIVLSLQDKTISSTFCTQSTPNFASASCSGRVPGKLSETVPEVFLL